MFGAGFFEDLGTAIGRVREGCCWIVAAGLGVGNASYRMCELWPNLKTLQRGLLGLRITVEGTAKNSPDVTPMIDGTHSSRGRSLVPFLLCGIQ